mmetsp:Transcript_30065/g.80733  ORF Transcript_30065/g.80733 Transcript_30065/m.80733 type:complete len:287 (+) Transcript_30065:305-1165(+)
MGHHTGGEQLAMGATWGVPAAHADGPVGYAPARVVSRSSGAVGVRRQGLGQARHLGRGLPRGLEHRGRSGEGAALLKLDVASLLSQGTRVAEEVRAHVTHNRGRDAVLGAKSGAAAAHEGDEPGDHCDPRDAENGEEDGFLVHVDEVIAVRKGHGDENGKADGHEHEDGHDNVAQKPLASVSAREGPALVLREEHGRELEGDDAGEEVRGPIAQPRAELARALRRLGGGGEEAHAIGATTLGHGSLHCDGHGDGCLVLRGRCHLSVLDQQEEGGEALKGFCGGSER